MKLRNTCKATKTRQYWANKSETLKKKQRKLKKLSKSAPAMKMSFMSTWVIPTLKQVASMYLQQVMLDVIHNSITSTKTVAQ
jgi:hypothetical protein